MAQGLTPEAKRELDQLRMGLHMYTTVCQQGGVEAKKSVQARFRVPDAGFRNDPETMCTALNCGVAAIEQHGDQTEKQQFLAKHPHVHVCTEVNCKRRTEKNWFHMRTHVHLDGLAFFLAHEKLDLKQVGAIVTALRAHGNVKSLEMNCCNVDDTSATMLFECIASIPCLRQVELFNNAFSHEGLPNRSVLSQALGHVHTLKLNGNKFLGDLGVTKVAFALPVGSPLTELYLNKVGMTDQAAASLSSALLESAHSLQIVSLRENSLTAAGMKSLSRVLSLPSLKDLQLRGNSIGDEGVTRLADAIRSTYYESSGNVAASLTSLELRETSITQTGVDALLSAVTETGTKIASLNLNDNQLGDSGMRVIAGYLNATQLKTLGLRSTGAQAEGGLAICEALRANETVTGVDLSANTLGDSVAAAMGEVTRVNPCLESIDFNTCVIGEAGATALATVLQLPSSRITHLDFSKNNSGAAGEQWAMVVERNTALVRLTLTDNGMKEAGVTRLYNALKRNRTLTSVHVYGADKDGPSANFHSAQLRRYLHQRKNLGGSPAPSPSPSPEPDHQYYLGGEGPASVSPRPRQGSIRSRSGQSTPRSTHSTPPQMSLSRNSSSNSLSATQPQNQQRRQRAQKPEPTAMYVVGRGGRPVRSNSVRSTNEIDSTSLAGAAAAAPSRSVTPPAARAAPMYTVAQPPPAYVAAGQPVQQFQAGMPVQQMAYPAGMPVQQGGVPVGYPLNQQYRQQGMTPEMAMKQMELLQLQQQQQAQQQQMVEMRRQQLQQQAQQQSQRFQLHQSKSAQEMQQTYLQQLKALEQHQAPTSSSSGGAGAPAAHDKSLDLDEAGSPTLNVSYASMPELGKSFGDSMTLTARCAEAFQTLEVNTPVRG